MLTKIEIDGFKTFREFSLDLQPFNVIAGANASGKSNLFDAVQFLSLLAETDLRSAASGLRGEPHELFHRSSDGDAARRITLAAEVLLDPHVRDPWGDEHTLIQTRLRYELVLERRPVGGLERLFVIHEATRTIRASEDSWARSFKETHDSIVSTRLRHNRRADLLETSSQDETPVFRIAQDGHQGRHRPAAAAETTVLSTMTTAEFPHLFALREEMRSWRFLQIDPISLRRAVDEHAPDRLEPNGSNLAAVLGRIRAETASEQEPHGLLTEISADLASLVPGVLGVEVRKDDVERQWQIMIDTRAAGEASSRVASDGTLRLLALLTALGDPRFGGVICFEEPENGVHPARLGPLIRHLRDLVKGDVEEEIEGTSLPLLQLIMTTHSPVVVGALEGEEGIFFDAVTSIAGDDSRMDVVTRARPVRRHYQQTLDPEQIGQIVTNAEVDSYLATVEVG
ncbi:MAG: AAA family ATPase [Solirubrobacteraceae bacterium]